MFMKKMIDLKQWLNFPTLSQTKFFVCVAFVFFTIVGCLQAQAQDDNNFGLSAAIENIDQLTGCSETEIRNAAVKSTETTQFPQTENDRNRIFFLYNVKTGLLLNAGGYWGTHVSLKEYGMPLWVHLESDNSTTGWIHFAQEFDKTGVSQDNLEGNYLEYVYKGSDTNTDQGVYVDRLFKKSGSSTIYYRGWKLEAVTGKTNIYRLYTYSPTSATPNGYFGSTHYYLIANSEQGDVDKNCGAVAQNSTDYTTAQKDGYDEWKIISYKQIFDLQSTAADNISKSIDLSFRLQCPGFDRENKSIKNWKTSKYGGNGRIRFGLEHYYKITDGKGTINSSYETSDISTTNPYTFPDGSDSRKFTSADDYERYCGKYYAADIKDAHGAIYQDIEVKHGGAYVVECEGFSNTTKAKLFAVVITKTQQSDGTYQAVNVPGTLHTTVFGQTTYMSEDEKTALHIQDQNMDYAAKEFYGNHKYISSVLVQVPNGGGIIRFGIEVGSHDNTEPGTGDDGNKEWTVFDDFRLLYASQTTDGDLILDADRDELNYLDNNSEKGCSNNYKNVTLHLNKSFTRDKWNGFILPVDLTRDQMTQAFGPNVRLAELEEVTDTKIRFKTIDLSNLGNDAIAMKAYIPYIIFPTKHLELETTPAYTAKLTKTGSNKDAQDMNIVIKKNHIDIPNVSFALTADNKNDLKNMDLKTWTTNSTKVVNATTGSPIVKTNNTMTAFGTFARTFAPTSNGTSNNDNYQVTDNTQDNYGEWILNNRSIIEGRDNLQGSYFYDGGNMYYSDKRVRGLRGFSVWFKPTTRTSSTAKIYLDEVPLDDTPTGIYQISDDEFFDEGANKVERFANGIYSLQGQLVRSNTSSTEGLPGGIYIVNGKKVAIK